MAPVAWAAGGSRWGDAIVRVTARRYASAAGGRAWWAPEIKGSASGEGLKLKGIPTPRAGCGLLFGRVVPDPSSLSAPDGITPVWRRPVASPLLWVAKRSTGPRQPGV